MPDDAHTLAGSKTVQNGRRKDMTLSRRAFGFSAAALAIVAAAPASAQSNLSAEDQATLRQAQAYLTALTAAQGNFIETGPGGQQRT
ncbi:MAG: outer membrane lipoprotein carrier protein LolA, partial [Brevundimonas sp.]